MPLRLIVMLWMLVALTGNVSAQSSLPPCPADPTAVWHNCLGMRGHLGGGRYTGEWQDNKRSGQGTQVLPSGARYVGEFKEDKFHGQGIFYEANRSIFRSGRWENDRVVQSFVIDTARFPFESEFERRLEAERLAREASERKATEARAEEERRRLEAERLAREANERKVAEARVEAERRRREAERQGSAAQEPNGQSNLQPCVEAANRIRHNCLGTQTFPSDARYDGEFRDNKFNGRGTFTFPDGERYVGTFRDGNRHGQGTNTVPNGERYVGEWRDGKQHGQGTYTFPSGARYVGEYREGKRSGLGTYTWPNGSRYVGEWRDGEEHGQGIRYAANGSILVSGRWEDGKHVQSYPLSIAQYPFTTPDSSAQAETLRRQAEAAAEAERKRRQELERQLVEERRKREAAERRANNAQESTGTGFMVSPGILVTNHHVVERCERLDIVSLDGRRTGVVLDKDESVDLALVRVTGLGGVVAVLRRPGSVRLGEPAYAFGFPLAGLLSEGGNFTNGVVSGLRGMRDSANEIQITTPVQPGNSGGAVIDSSGNVMGVVVSKLNAAAVAKATGDIPQNVNFAVSVAALADFLARNKVSYRTAERGASIDSAQLADMARSVSHRIVCTQQVTTNRGGAGPQGSSNDTNSGDTTVVLWNQSAEAIFSVFVSPVASDKWGVDQLGREIISPGGRFTLKPPASQGCVYDVRVEFKSGKHQEKRNQNFCRMVDLKIDG